MARVHQIRNIKVYVNARGEHPPPHVHVLGPGWTVAIYIRTRETRKGRGPLSDLREIKTWIEANEEFLLQKWDELNERDH
jgi:hypothetical protein